MLRSQAVPNCQPGSPQKPRPEVDRFASGKGGHIESLFSCSLESVLVLCLVKFTRGEGGAQSHLALLYVRNRLLRTVLSMLPPSLLCSLLNCGCLCGFAVWPGARLLPLSQAHHQHRMTLWCALHLLSHTNACTQPLFPLPLPDSTTGGLCQEKLQPSTKCDSEWQQNAGRVTMWLSPRLILLHVSLRL